MGYIASPMLDINYMLGNLIGRGIVISLFAYVLWYVYNNMNMTQTVYIPEERRFGRSNGFSRHARQARYGRIRR